MTTALNNPVPLFGAVSYLNMLPFFCESTDTKLFSTPAELNECLGTGPLLAGCSSVIAGFQQDLAILPGQFGVAAEHEVGSVFFEPIVKETNEAGVGNRWLNILNENRHLGAHGLIGSKNKSLSKRETVKIFTSGASAQSIWILQSLLELQGYQCETILITPELAQSSVQHLHREFSVGHELACLLMIGDPALERRFRRPQTSENGRIDLAQFWQDFSGLPCIFALWFLSKSASLSVFPSQLSALSPNIEARAQKWAVKSSSERLLLARSFLENSKSSNLLSFMSDLEIESYLDQLRFRLHTDAYTRSLNLMKEIYSLQKLKKAESSMPEERLNNFSSQKVGVFQSFNCKS